MEKSLDEIIGRGRNRGSHGRVGKPRNNNRKGRAAFPGKLNEVKVSNLDPDLTEDDISSLFSKAGDIINVDLKINTHGVSTGVAFVEFADSNAANKAIDLFHMRLAVGKTITVTSTASLSDRIGVKQGKKQASKNKKPKKEQPVAKSAEDLDNELSLYMQQQQEQAQQEQTQHVSEPIIETVNGESEPFNEDLIIDE